jgi:hypothetical protein
MTLLMCCSIKCFLHVEVDSIGIVGGSWDRWYDYFTSLAYGFEC